jgi:hypothetical protein
MALSSGAKLGPYEILAPLASSGRALFKKIEPSDLAGLYMFPSATFSRDGKSFAYSYLRTLSELYTVDGLR